VTTGEWASLIGIGVMFFILGYFLSEGSEAARESCYQLGMFAEKHSGEWVCVDHPEWKRVPK